MEELKAQALVTAKMLLGIKDGESDDLLSFLIDDAVMLILGYCRIDVIPRQLESVIPSLAAEMYRRRGYGSGELPKDIKSVSEGERSVTYADNISEEDLLCEYYKRLNPFVKKKGRVPSDVT